MDDALIHAVERRYALEIAGASPIQQGFEAFACRAETERGPVVVHIGPTWRSSQELGWVHRVVQHAARRVPQAIPPLTARDGATSFRHDGHPVTLYEFVDGAPLNASLPAARAHSARVLASLHAALAGWSGGGRPTPHASAPHRWDPRDDPPELVDRALDGWRDATYPSLPSGVVHGDYYPGNVLSQRQRVVAVIDWHEARIAPIVAEIAWAAWEIAQDERLRFIPDRAASFLEAYGPSAPHLDLAIPFIRVWLRENIRYVLALARDGQPIDDRYHASQLRAFSDLRP